MKWFTESIPEAINLAKQQKTLLVVLIYDSTDASKSITESLESEEVKEVMTTNKYVALRLQVGSPDAVQFSQIYPVVLLPSLFFIQSETGIPLEVIGGSVSSETLLEKIAKLQTGDSVKDKKNSSPEPKPAEKSQQGTPPVKQPSPAPQSSSGGASVLVESDPEDIEPKLPEGCLKPQPPQPTPSSSNAEMSEAKSLEEKVKIAKEALLKKQEQKEEETKELEREKEIERRKMGQEMRKAKQKREEDEVIQAASSIKKEKQEDILAREEIKRKIQADKEEREYRASLLRPQQPTAAAESAKIPVVQPSSSQSNVARIKFRFPDGSSVMNQFTDETRLSEVREFVRSNSSLSRFNMTSTIHQRPFNDQDMNKTLRELGLVPSVIIIVSPITRSDAMSLPANPGSLMTYIWMLLSPLTALLGFVQRMFGLGGEAPHNDPPTPRENPAPSTGSYTTRNRPKSSYGSRGASAGREGNIRRFHNQDDDDEDDKEKKTWNGNSTQQM